MNGPREIDLAVVPEDRRMVNDPRSTAEDNVPVNTDVSQEILDSLNAPSGEFERRMEEGQS